MGKVDPFRPVKSKALKFHLRDVAAALVKLADIHEGLWQLQVIFANNAVNMNLNNHMAPTAMASVVALQLGRVEALDELTVDAAQVNPSSRIVIPPGAVLQ